MTARVSGSAQCRILEHHDQRPGPGQPPQQTQHGLAPHRRRRIPHGPRHRGPALSPRAQGATARGPCRPGHSDHAAPGAALGSTAGTGCWRRRGPPGQLPPPPPAPWRRLRPPREQAGTCRYPPRPSRTPSCRRHQRRPVGATATRQAPPLAPTTTGHSTSAIPRVCPVPAPATSRPVTVIAATRRSFSMPPAWAGGRPHHGLPVRKPTLRSAGQDRQIRAQQNLVPDTASAGGRPHTRQRRSSSPHVRRRARAHRHGRSTRHALYLGFNLFPGQRRFCCMRYCRLRRGAGSRGAGPLVLPLRRPGPGREGFATRAGVPEQARMLRKPRQADPSRGQRPGRDRAVSPRRARPAARGRASRSWACAAIEEPDPAVGLLGALTFAAVRPRMLFRVRMACSMSNLAR